MIKKIVGFGNSFVFGSEQQNNGRTDIYQTALQST